MGARTRNSEDFENWNYSNPESLEGRPELSKAAGGLFRWRAEVKKGFHACGIVGIDLERSSGHLGTRLAEAGCDAFTIAQLFGHSDVRVDDALRACG